MPDWCQVILRRGGAEVALDECSFRMPCHFRGVKPSTVTIKQGGQRYDELSDLTRGDGILEVVFLTPDETGQFVESVMKCWDILEVRDGPGESCEIDLIDFRRELANYTCTQDINLKSWTGYVPGTAGYESGVGPGGNTRSIEVPVTTVDALGLFSLQSPIVDKYLPGYLENVPDEEIRDDIYLAGLQMDQAVEVLQQVLGVDFTVNPATREYFWQARQDDSGSVPTELQDWSWLQRPGWLDKAARRTGIPAQIIGPYRRRITLRVINTDYPDTTDSTDIIGSGPQALPGQPKAQFEQVYEFAGHWLTLGDMLEGAGYSRTAITNAEIAKNIQQDNWLGTAISQGARPSNVSEGICYLVQKAIKDSWRLYYALRFLNKNNLNLWGGYSDIRLGENNLGGGFRSGQVFCDWTEVLPKPRRVKITKILYSYQCVFEHRQGLPYPEAPLEKVPFRWTGQDGNKYINYTASPFRLEWQDEEYGIVKIVADRNRTRGSTAFVGRPTRASLRYISQGIARKDDKAFEEANRQVAAAKIEALPTESLRGLQFRSTYDLSAYITAIVETPQGAEGEPGDRFYEVKSATYDGDIDEARIPVPDLPEAVFGVGDDQYSPRNLPELRRDLDKRALDYRNELAAKAQGPGETLDVHKLIPRVMDREMAYTEIVVSENVITGVVHMGNYGDPGARDRISKKREAGRKFRLAGKKTG